MKTFYLCVLLFFTNLLYAQKPGTLDKTFGRNGRLKDTLARAGNRPPMLVQPDDKILTGGSGAIDSTGTQTFQINRIYNNGAPDNTFGNKGKLLVKIKLPDDETNYQGFVSAMTLQSDGKIIAAGTYHLPNEYYGNLTVIRLFPDGTIDSAFGINGVAMPDVRGKSMAVDMAVQSDGKIVIGGINIALGFGAFFLERLLPNGNLDSNFANKGKVNDKQGKLNALAIQPDGKILAAGDITSKAQIPTRILIRRYLSNGSPDLTFGKDGAVDTLLSKRYESHLYNIALQPDGRIVCTGSYDGTQGSPQALLTQYLPNGTIDKSFGSDGVVDFPYLAYLSKILLYKNRIVLAGTKYPSYTTNFSDIEITSCYNNGSIDSSFATNGLSIIDNQYSDYLFNAVMQRDGNIVLSGAGQNIRGDFAVTGLCRYYGYPTQPMVAYKEGKLSIPAIAPSLHIYPNPASNYITISGLPANAQSTIIITDGLGKAIAFYKANNTAQYRVDVSKLTAGVYYAEVQLNGKREVLKFVKD